jgi:hypothetical protein
MAVKIAKRIVAYKVMEPAAEKPQAAEELERAIEKMSENISRPETLRGSTYKIKTPLSEHALYITINDIVLNEGTAHEQRRPYEVFINSKNMDHFQWVLALTRVVSAVFRKGGDCTFLVEELKAVFDPKGGYFKKGGRFMPSLVAEIGDCIEKHLIDIGMLRTEELDEHQSKLIEEKRGPVRGEKRPYRTCRRKRQLPAGRATVQQVLDQGDGHDGWLHDLPELRRLQVRLSTRRD